MGIELRGKNGAIDLSRKMMKGDDGGYYIPSIDSEGNLTWAPSETEMPAVEGANIKGQKGDPGTSGVWVGDTEPTGDYNVWIDPTGSETAGLVTQAELANKQDKLTAGTNITIDSNNVISATGGGGSYTLPVANRHTLGGVKIENNGDSAKLGTYVLMDEENKLYVPIVDGVSHPGVVSINENNFSLTRDPYGRKCILHLNKPEIKNKYLGGVCPDGTTITMTSDGTISASAPPTATTSTLGLVKPDGNMITITKDGTISVDKSKISASNGLPAGGGYPQILMKNSGVDYDTTWANLSDLLLMAGINMGASWQVTTSTSDGNLYNAKEVVIFWQDSNYNRHQSYLNVGCDYYGNSSQTWGSSNWINTQIILDGSTQAGITYDGSNVNTTNMSSIDAILYKT